MRTLVIASLMLLSVAVPAAEPRVAVNYREVEKFTDFGLSRWDRERNEKAFAGMLESLGERLQPGQRLSLTLTDVNLAGEEEWWRFRGHEVRVLRNVTWPALEFDFQLSDASGRVVKTGSTRLTDMSYLRHSLVPVSTQSDAFRYEQRMMERWLKDELLR